MATSTQTADCLRISPPQTPPRRYAEEKLRPHAKPEEDAGCCCDAPPAGKAHVRRPVVPDDSAQCGSRLHPFGVPQQVGYDDGRRALHKAVNQPQRKAAALAHVGDHVGRPHVAGAVLPDVYPAPEPRPQIGRGNASPQVPGQECKCDRQHENPNPQCLAPLNIRNASTATSTGPVLYTCGVRSASGRSHVELHHSRRPGRGCDRPHSTAAADGPARRGS